MRNLLLSIFILNFSQVYCQKEWNADTDWDKILIVDGYGGWSHFNNNFEIDRTTLNLVSINNPDSIVKEIEPQSVETLFNALSCRSSQLKDPLSYFGKDSVWLMNNAESLWRDYIKDTSDEEIDKIAVQAIQNYKQASEVAFSMQGARWTDDYPFVEIGIVRGADTLLISSHGQYPYMLPWDINGKVCYSFEVAEAIGNILPNFKDSNKPRLMGEHFNYHLVDGIYQRFIETAAEYHRARNRYPKRFAALEEHFEVESASLSLMASIEWGGNFGAPCIDMILSDPTESQNIQFETVFGRRLILHPMKPLIRKKKSILDGLSGNPVYEYCIAGENRLGQIHFVNKKSLSGQAKREFLRDVKANGQESSKFKGKFKKAIFFELSEFQDDGRSFSRWIFLKDGTLILWQLKGSYLLNLSDEYTEENGYVCRVISRDEL
jgi:hypothetical protein